MSSLMAVRALLGVEIFRRHAEHIVTLDAHPVQNRLPRLRRLVLGRLDLRVWLGTHSEILAQPSGTRNPAADSCWANGIPVAGRRIERKDVQELRWCFVRCVELCYNNRF
jgi:hypothetical protein